MTITSREGQPCRNPIHTSPQAVSEARFCPDVTCLSWIDFKFRRLLPAARKHRSPSSQDFSPQISFRSDMPKNCQPRPSVWTDEPGTKAETTQTDYRSARNHDFPGFSRSLCSKSTRNIGHDLQDAAVSRQSWKRMAGRMNQIFSSSHNRSANGVGSEGFDRWPQSLGFFERHRCPRVLQKARPVLSGPHVEIFHGSESITPGVVGAATRAPHLPKYDANTGPLVSFVRSGTAAPLECTGLSEHFGVG